MQAAATVTAANGIVGAERVVLLHLDRATGAVALGLGNLERYLGEELASLGPFAVVGLNVEAAKSYRLLREIVGQAAAYVDEAGTVLVAGPRRGGGEGGRPAGGVRGGGGPGAGGGPEAGGGGGGRGGAARAFRGGRAAGVSQGRAHLPGGPTAPPCHRRAVARLVRQRGG